MKTIKEQIEELLADLETKPNIADYFREIKLKSPGRTCYDCPLSTYLSEKTGTRVGVTRDDTFYYENMTAVLIPLGDKARQLSWDIYMCGKYPDLIEETK